MKKNAKQEFEKKEPSNASLKSYVAAFLGRLTAEGVIRWFM